MEFSKKTFKLNTGARIPAVGFGTWQAAPGEAGRAMQTAIRAGYRHVDCAPLYWNEKEIGLALTEVLKETAIPRSELFITTKLWSSQHSQVEPALRKSLQDLHLDYVDLYLMHWPVSLPPNDASAPNFGKEDRTAEMEKLLDTGLVKAIGVANCSTINLEKLLMTARIVPAVNQTELHPLLPQDKLSQYCKAKGIHQTAFGPLGGKGSTLHTHPMVLDIAEKNKGTSGQVLLSWGSTWAIFRLDETEIAKLDRLAKTEGRRFNRPNWRTTIFHDDDKSVG
ncbi:NADP-dependent oxidoreductase domain-containing protein [Clohesyomyces aquaticus]|uniref:NADP-dependent oxidoreductase domain-containing protein n=1 Tax=Clohesyomyces aquaticus TaxID=1231657 RepID=A0A1Y1Y3S8_9PLEO|nr:NADP-dependent oxidoreductase domain-containing protein [Clohesyomyces aquaticus]